MPLFIPLLFPLFVLLFSRSVSVFLAVFLEPDSHASCPFTTVDGASGQLAFIP